VTIRQTFEEGDLNDFLGGVVVESEPDSEAGTGAQGKG